MFSSVVLVWLLSCRSCVPGVTSAGRPGGPVHSAGEGWSGQSGDAAQSSQHVLQLLETHIFYTIFAWLFFNWMPLAPLASAATENNQRSIATEDFLKESEDFQMKNHPEGF